MKILCLIDSLGSGGAQRQLVNLAIGFKERGHDISFLVYHNINFFKKILDNNNIQVYEIIESNYIRRLLNIRKHIRNGSYDSVVSFLEGPNFIATLSGFPYRNWKLIVGERSANPHMLKSLKLWFYRIPHLFTDYVVSNSFKNIEMVKTLNPILNSRKFKVIYNVVDSNIWKPAADYEISVDEKFHIVVAASHQYLKNAKGLVEALNNMNDTLRSNLVIDWYGDESSDNSFKEVTELVNKYSLNNVITFYKATAEITNKMKYADAVGLFSLYEGLPNVICEAMSLGKPVISSSVSDVPLLINEANLLFNPNNIDEITKALCFLCSLNVNELEEIGKANRTKSKELFDKKEIINKYLNLLN